MPVPEVVVPEGAGLPQKVVPEDATVSVEDPAFRGTSTPR
jgi:hypothetical protein